MTDYNEYNSIIRITNDRPDNFASNIVNFEEMISRFKEELEVIRGEKKKEDIMKPIVVNESVIYDATRPNN